MVASLTRWPLKDRSRLDIGSLSGLGDGSTTPCPLAPARSAGHTTGMVPSDELPRSRSRAKHRKLALEAAVVCCVVAAGYARLVRYDPIPLLLCLAVAAVLALIGFALPDRPPPSDEMRDYEEGQRGTIPDGRDPL